MGKRIKAALLCKTLPPNDNPAEYVNGSSNAPSRNLVTAIKLAGYVVHCGTGGKVSAVDGDGREVTANMRSMSFLETCSRTAVRNNCCVCLLSRRNMSSHVPSVNLVVHFSSLLFLGDGGVSMRFGR